MRTFAVVLSFIACCVQAGLVPIESEESVRNGNVEGTSAVGGVAGWTHRKDLPAGVALDVVASGDVARGRCLHIGSSYGEDRPWFWWEQRVPLSAGAYQFRMVIKSRGLSQGGVVVLSGLNADGKRVFRQTLLGFPKSQPEWREFRVDLSVPPGVVRGNLQLSMHGAGEVWLDDISLVRKIGPKALSVADSRLYPVRSVPQAKVSVDGATEDWQGVPRSLVRQAYQVSHAEAIVMDQERSKGSVDLSFSLALQADAAALYLLVEVRDDVRRIRKPFWQGDSVQIALDPTYARSANGFGLHDVAFSLVPGADGPEYHGEHPASWRSQPNGVRVASRDRPDGYVCELALPWTALGVTRPGPGTQVGLCVVVNDNDGAGRKWAQWTPGIATGKYPNQFGAVLLVGDSVGVHVVPTGGAMTDIRPTAFDLTLVNLGEVARDLSVTVSLDDEAPSDTREVSVPPGLLRVPLLYAAGSVPAGMHRLTVRVPGGEATTRVEVEPLRAILTETGERLAALHPQTDELRQLVAKGRAAKLDMAYPDATLTVAENFLRWIPADLAREGDEGLARREAERLGERVLAAIAEAKDILAHPKRHPERPKVDILQAKLRGGNWEVRGRPVFLIGFNQFDEDWLADLPRLGGNFTTVGGGTAAHCFRDGPEFDTAYTDQLRERVAVAAGLGIRSNLLFGHRMPKWAIDEWPDITAAEGHFMYYDISHPEAVRLSCRVAETVARAVGKLPGMTSYDLWNEAAFSAMSPRALADFRASLERTYGTIGALNAAWDTKYTQFGEVKAVTRDPDQPAAYMDWVTWNDDRFTGFIRQMRAAVRRGDPDALTNVKLSNEAAIVGSLNHAFRPQATSRHNMGVDRYALAQLLELQGCDTRPTLFSPDYAFAWRYPGMAYDLQRSMAPDKPINDSEWHGVQTVYFEDVDQPASFLNASLWFSYLHGMDMNITWWWSRNGNGPKAKWFAGSLLAQPQLLDAWARNSIEVQRFASEIVAFQEAPSPIRLLFSKPSAVLDLSYLDCLRSTYETMHWLGRQIGFVTEEQLLAGPDKIDLLVVPGAKHASPGVREAIARLAGQGTKVVRIGEDTLSLTPAGKPWPDAMAAGTVAAAEPSVAEWTRLVDEACGPCEWRAIGPDGVGSKPVEFRTVRVREQVFGYLIGLGRETSTIRLLRGRRPARWHDLRTHEQGQGEIVVAPYDVRLLDLD
jgi:beta-galactosidase